jgi:hypothetical protein
VRCRRAPSVTRRTLTSWSCAARPSGLSLFDLYGPPPAGTTPPNVGAPQPTSNDRGKSAHRPVVEALQAPPLMETGSVLRWRVPRNQGPIRPTPPAPLNTEGITRAEEEDPGQGHRAPARSRPASVSRSGA